MQPNQQPTPEEFRKMLQRTEELLATSEDMLEQLQDALERAKKLLAGRRSTPATRPLSAKPSLAQPDP
jgi:hypothetical protein